ncbi:MAG: flagellar biosynthetic protein FliQ [Verrucomicrobiota bacterium]|nr:flagellar biosynthetic protein FliQ [Verrucomicrobiota bacterium]MDG1891501.1 flagellar biosynthetic protein FliQ [Verrucomicrobiota bacterium]
MNPDFAVELIRMMLLKATQLASPILFTGMLIGVSISVIQTVTSVNEQTLTFVPKTIGIAAFLLIASPWILRTLIEYTTWMIQLTPEMVK